MSDLVFLHRNMYYTYVCKGFIQVERDHVGQTKCYSKKHVDSLKLAHQIAPAASFCSETLQHGFFEEFWVLTLPAARNDFRAPLTIKVKHQTRDYFSNEKVLGQ